MIGRLFLCGMVLCGRLLSQDPQIAWESDFDATLKAAKADGKPIMVAFIMDQESANDEVAKVHFHEKDVVETSKSFHCLIASVGIHAKTSAEGPCPRFGCATCAVHQKIQMRAQTAYLQSTEISAPQFLFLKSDGETMLLRHVWMLTPKELVKKMRLALGFSDPAKAGEAEKQAAQDVAQVLEQANDNNMNKRIEAFKKLALLDDPRIIEFLIKQTAEAVEEARRLEAIAAMGTKGNAKALPVLVKLLQSKSAQIRNHVAISLEKLAMPEAGPHLRAALKAEQKDLVKGNLARALAVCDPKTPEHVKTIVSMIEAGGQKERIAAIRASLDLSVSESLKKALMAAAKDNNAQIRGAAFCALAKHAVKEAVPILEKAAPSEKTQDVKSAAQGALSILTKPGYDGQSPADLMNKFLDGSGR
jgi:HEAT repeat protein